MPSEQIRVCWLTGSYFLRKEVVDKIKGFLVDYSISVFSDDENDANKISSDILENKLFEDVKLIILRKIPPFSSSKASTIKWTKIFSSIPDHVTVVIDGVDRNKYKSLYNHVKKIGKVFNMPSYLYQKDSIQWLENRFSKYNIKLHNCNLGNVISNMPYKTGKGTNIDDLYLFAEKVCAYLGKRKRLDTDDISAVLSGYSTFVLWNFFNYLDDRNVGKCLKSLENACMFSSNSNVAYEILNFACSRFKLMLFVKERLLKGKSEQDIVKEISNLHKMSRSGSGEKTKYTPKTSEDGSYLQSYSSRYVSSITKAHYGKLSVVSRYKTIDMVKAIKCCQEGLLRLRVKSNDVESILSVDNLIFTLCGTIEESELLKLRAIPGERICTS